MKSIISNDMGWVLLECHTTLFILFDLLLLDPYLKIMCL